MSENSPLHVRQPLLVAELDRRRFLRLAGLSGAALSLSGALAGCKTGSAGGPPPGGS